MASKTGSSPWPEEDIRILQKMWRDGHSSMAIADKLNRNPSAIRQYVANNRDAIGLMARKRTDVLPYKNISEFDKQWYGTVPFGHWMITKPWRKAS
jgi:hypothetical protein